MSASSAHSDRRRPPPEFWARAEAARAEGLITWGALGYLRVLVRLARARGDGRSFTLGERVIEEITGISRRNCQRWRAQLAQAGLIAFDRRWAYKRGWFWEARTSLVFPGSSGDKMVPEAKGVLLATKWCQNSGDKIAPSLIGKKEPSVKGGGRRGKPRRNPQHEGAANPPPTTTPPGASTTSKTEAAKGGGAPTPTGQPAPPGPPDAKGPPTPAIPWEEQARRVREIIAKLRHVARPGPVEPADDDLMP